MNEEELADSLSKHLEALLAGESLDEIPPEEVAQLLALAEGLEALAPQPRPAFGATLKESLLKLPPGGNGSAPAAGGFFPWGPIVLLVAVLGTVMTLLLVAGGIAWQTLRADNSVSPSPAVPVETATSQLQLVPVTATASPLPTATAIPTSTQAPEPSPTYTPVPVSPTFTPVVDVLPAITTTVETAQELPLPPGLVPGSESSGSSDNGGGSSSGSGGSGGNSGGGGSSGGGDNDDGGDGNKGHGNDADGHDEDNPGHK